MQHFIGTYECKADAKGRIMIPVALKKQLSAVVSKGFVLKRAVFNSCLELYPMQEWEQLMTKINKVSDSKLCMILAKYLIETYDKQKIKIRPGQSIDDLSSSSSFGDDISNFSDNEKDYIKRRKQKEEVKRSSML